MTFLGLIIGDQRSLITANSVSLPYISHMQILLLSINQKQTHLFTRSFGVLG